MRKIALLPVLFLLFILHPVKVQQTGFASSDGVDIYYYMYGSGEPLLVINGGPGFSSEGFSGLAERLAEKYRVILYDQRGTGKSTMNTVDSDHMTMDLMVKDLEALRKHLNICQWMILGHSFGGVLGNYYTAKYPEHISGLIASSSGGVDLGLLEYFDITQQLTPAETDSLRYWTARVNEGDTTTYADQKRREFFAAAYVYHDEHIPQVAERLSQGNSSINGLIWRDLQSIQYDVSEELSGFDKPVLILQGKQDIIREKTALRAAEIFPNAELVLMDHCGHYGWLDQPEEYFEKVFSFQERVLNETAISNDKRE